MAGGTQGFNIPASDEVYGERPATLRPLFRPSVATSAPPDQTPAGRGERSQAPGESAGAPGGGGDGERAAGGPKASPPSRNRVIVSPRQVSAPPDQNLAAQGERGRVPGESPDPPRGEGDGEGAAGGLKTSSSTRNRVIVSPRQRGNPVLRFIRNVAWEFGDIVPDYELGPTTCALFLSLRYHNLKPDYIHQRLQTIGHSYTLRLVLVQVDVSDASDVLKELAKISLLANTTLILAWSADEIGRYLETYKAFESKPADCLQERTGGDFISQVTDCLTTVKSVNKTDCLTLLSTFKNLKRVVGATKDELSLCPGLGFNKARRLHAVFNEPFLKSRNLDT